MTGELFNKQHY